LLLLLITIASAAFAQWTLVEPEEPVLLHQYHLKVDEFLFHRNHIKLPRDSSWYIPF
jgi:hypothetical protein